MSESSLHVALVSEMSRWITDKYCGGEEGHLLIDSTDGSVQSRPPIVFGHIPDVYTRSCPLCALIIGEAKTAKDIECPHSERQFEAYLRHCKLYDDSVFVVAVPWYMTRCVKSFIEMIQDRVDAHDVHIEVIDKLPG